MTKEDREFFDMQKGIQYEKDGDIENAIKMYEKLIKNGFDGSRPYDRLCVIYRKQKSYTLEEKVLLKAISKFSKITEEGYRDDGSVKLERYKNRLEKLHKIMEKE